MLVPGRHALPGAATGRRVGGSSGTNLIGALLVAQRMVAAGESGSVVAILCDGGERYSGTYYDPAWLAAQGFELTRTAWAYC